MYRATVHVQGNQRLIQSCFSPEDKGMKGRSAYSLKKEQGGVMFEVTAQDSVALRAHLNTITKMLTVVEKMQRI